MHNDPYMSRDDDNLTIKNHTAAWRIYFVSLRALESTVDHRGEARARYSGEIGFHERKSQTTNLDQTSCGSACAACRLTFAYKACRQSKLIINHHTLPA
jgi:hypothetical protein